MLPKYRIADYVTYGFHFNVTTDPLIAGIHAIGWEKQTSHTYDWDGLSRNEIEVIVFQYTLKGQGAIRIGDEVHSLKAGDAFFVKIPSDHRYYLPEDSEEWEFIYISLVGTESNKYYQSISNHAGHILKLDMYAEPIRHIFKLLSNIAEDRLNDPYITSSAAYTFLMELQRFILHIENNQAVPDPVKKATAYMNENYGEQLSLDDIVDVSGLSKYHFTRLFHKTVHVTPIQYLTKVRINRAIELLKNKTLTIENIAVQVGFSNGNYFNKVFRSVMGMSPGNYRNNKLLISVDHLIM